MIDYDMSAEDVTIRNGDIVMVEGDLSTRQRIEQKLRLWRGEWFLDVNAGFPWLQEIMGQRPRPEVLRSLIFDLVTNDPGVVSVQSLEVSFEGVDRKLNIIFTARLTNGQNESMDITI